MFDLDDTSWIANSVTILNPVAEITFLVSPMYHPDPNGADEAAAIRLPLPAAATGKAFGLSSIDVVGHEPELVAHYRAVLQLADRCGHSYNQFHHHMWLRLHIAGSEGGIGFAWYDTLNEMNAVFDWLDAAADGAMWSDVEQGWELIIVRMGSRFHFRQGAFDQGGEHANIAMPRDDLLASILELRERISLIVQRLTTEVGEDYWTSHRYDLRNDLS